VQLLSPAPNNGGLLEQPVAVRKEVRFFRPDLLGDCMRSVKIDNNLFVYFGDKLIYKKWIGTSQPSRLFNEHWPNQEIK